MDQQRESRYRSLFSYEFTWNPSLVCSALSVRSTSENEGYLSGLSRGVRSIFAPVGSRTGRSVDSVVTKTYFRSTSALGSLTMRTQQLFCARSKLNLPKGTIRPLPCAVFLVSPHT